VTGKHSYDYNILTLCIPSIEQKLAFSEVRETPEIEVEVIVPNGTKSP